jgi:AcrR family transcriptional regulator
MDDPISKPQSQRVRQKERTRRRLTTALCDVVSRDGYGNASVDAVSKVAGISRGTFYLHFSSKAELAEEVIAGLRERWRASAPAAVTSTSSTDEIESVVDAWVSFYSSELDAFRVWHEAALVDPSIVTRVLRGSASLAHDVLPSFPAGTNDALMTLRLSMMFIHLDQLCYGWCLSEAKPYPRQLLVREVAHSWKWYFLPRLEENAGE